MRVTCTINGAPAVADDVWEGESLLFVLRDRLGLPGSRNACCTSSSVPPAATPSTVRTSRPCACPAATRHAQTTTPSR